MSKEQQLSKSFIAIAENHYYDSAPISNTMMNIVSLSSEKKSEEVDILNILQYLCLQQRSLSAYRNTRSPRDVEVRQDSRMSFCQRNGH